MEPLVTTKQVLMWLGAIPFEKNISKRKRQLSTIFVFLCFLSQLCTFAAGMAYVIKFISINFERSLYEVCASLAFLTMMYVFVVAMFMRQKTLGIFEELSAIHAQSKTLKRTKSECEVENVSIESHSTFTFRQEHGSKEIFRSRKWKIRSHLELLLQIRYARLPCEHDLRQYSICFPWLLYERTLWQEHCISPLLLCVSSP